MKHLTAGIDVGSSAIKVAIVESSAGQNVEILATAVQRIRRRNVHEVVSSTFAEALGTAKRSFDELLYVASTGDGESVASATGHFYGITTHGRGAVLLVPQARAALDMGALHARALKTDERGKVLAHRMTSQCASGTGQFLENIARYLGIPIEDIGPLSKTAKAPEDVSSICAVLAETDVINMVSRGISTADILKGIHMSIAGRLAKLLRSAGVEGLVTLTGGMARDEGLVETLREELAQKGAKKGQAPIEVVAHPLSACAGALGAAALSAQRYVQLERSGKLDSLRRRGESHAAL